MITISEITESRIISYNYLVINNHTQKKTKTTTDHLNHTILSQGQQNFATNYLNYQNIAKIKSKMIF